MEQRTHSATRGEDDGLSLPRVPLTPSWEELGNFARGLKMVCLALASSAREDADATTYRGRSLGLTADIAFLERIERGCTLASKILPTDAKGRNLRKCEERLGRIALAALVSVQREDAKGSGCEQRCTFLAGAKADLLRLFREHGAGSLASSLTFARERILNRSVEASLVNESQIARLTVQRLSSFLFCRRSASTITVSPFDTDFRSLLLDVGNIVREFTFGAPERVAGPNHRHQGDGPTALEVLRAVGTAADMLLLSHAITKMGGGFRGDTKREYLPQSCANEDNRTELRMPTVSKAPLPFDYFQTFVHLTGRLPSCTDTRHLRGITGSVVTSRESLVLQMSGSLDTFDMVLISCQNALSQLASISSGSAPLYQGDGVPNPRLTESLLQLIVPRLPLDPRAVSNSRPLGIVALGTALNRMEATLHELASHYEEGGSLVGGYFQGLAHQVPRGIDPMAGPIHALSVGSNGAHVGMTHFPALESEINKLVRMRGILFQKPWREGVGIPTSGGTASNNLSADLALSSAGSGHALKLACENMGVDLIVSWKGRGVDLKDLDATQALMIHPESLSGGVRQLEGKQREQLRKEFKAQLKSVQKQYPPLVAIPRGEWAHYTLERHLRAAAGDNLIRVPINANTEMDFEWLRGEIEQSFKDGPRPLIVPLTFCNTGLGRAGYDGKSLTQFVTWFANTYGAPPLGIVDAAQGSLLFGIHQKRLSNEILEAREMLGEFAMCMTLDPHKTSLPLPCSVWVVKDPSWAMFATGTSVEHSYLEASDAAELRESTQLSTPLESAMIAFKYFRNLRTGEHNDIFAPVLKSAENAYQSLQETVLHVTVSGREFRMIAPFEPHSGILGVCFVPVDGDMSMRAANEALMKVRELLVGDRGSSLSCSAYSLALSAFSSAALVKEKILTPGVRWEGVEKVEFLRFVFGQGSQEGVVLEVLPKIISERFS